MQKMNWWVRRILLLLAVLAAVITAGWYGLHWIPYDVSFGAQTTFAIVPADDQALAKWVRSQPGIWLAGENRWHEKDGRWRVEIIFGISRNGWGPSPPDLNAAAAELGYMGPEGPFRDSPREN
jgi:hypothetical protein